MALFSRSKGPRDARAVEPTEAPAPSAGPEHQLPAAPEPDGAGLRGIDDHRDYLLSLVTELRPFGIGLLDAGGLTLCESLASGLDLPIHHSAAVPGWAVRAANLVGADGPRPIAMPIAGEIRAGADRVPAMIPGTAVYVEEGAPLPDGADAVVAVEDAEAAGGEVEFRHEVSLRQNLRLAGSRIADGGQLIERGSPLTPRALGLIAEVGLDKVLARPRPRVAVVTSAADLIEPGRPLTSLSQRYDATTPMIVAAARRDGAQVFGSPIVPPDPRLVATAVGEQLVRADLVVLIADVTPELVRALAGLGSFDVARVDGFAGPMVVGLVEPERTPLVVLPVGPVPAYLAYGLFVRPLIERLAGQQPSEPELVDARLTETLGSDPLLTRLVLADTNAGLVRPLPSAGEQGAAELADANTVAFVPAGVAPLAAGATVVCWLLD